MTENEILATKDLFNFVNLYGIKAELGTELDYYSHFFLIDILNDFTPNQVWMKGAQLGLSTLQIIKTIWACKNKGWDIIYTLPTSDFARDFVSGKVNRIIQQNPIFQKWTEDKDSIEQKQIGDNMIHYRGAQISKQAISVSADLVVNDEVDRSDLAVISQYETRLQHSKYKGRWLFSNPSLEGNGVSRWFKDSTQNHYFIKCPYCNKWQFLDWPDNFDMVKEIYVCSKCRGELSDEDRRVGQWVKKYNDKEFSGYWIPLFIAPWVTAKEVIKKEKEMSRDIFYNFVLGKAYCDSNATITPDVIYRNLVPSINREKKVVIGCDSGIIKHYVVGTIDGLFDYGKTEHWEDIELLIQKYPNSICVIDAMPDITKPRELKEKYNGRVFLGTFVGDRNKMELFDWGQGDDYGTVLIERNRTVQHIVGEMVDCRFPFEGNQNKWEEFASHWLTMYRVFEKGKNEKEKMFWKSTNGKDHFVFAQSLFRAGISKFNESASFHGSTKSIEDILQVDKGVETLIFPE